MKKYMKHLKLLPMSLIVGILTGIVSYVFLKSLEFVYNIRTSYPVMFALLPIVGILTAYFYHKYGKGSHKGNNLIIESVHKEIYVPFRLSFFTFIFTILTHLAGGSVGREGTAVQIGGAFANKLSRVFKLKHQDKRLIIMSGISAGFGSVFGTPLAGVFFGMEMCFIGKLEYRSLIPCFLASYSANYVCILLGITHQTFLIKNMPDLNIFFFLIIIISSVAFGLTGKLFSISVHALKSFYSKIINFYILRIVVGSVVVLFVMLLLDAFKFAGLSTWMINSGFSGTVGIFDPLIKFILTILTLGAGFQGGEVTPLFDIGASLGGLIGQFSNIEPSFLAGLGLISVFGCAANAPVTTIMLGIELFGVRYIPFYVISVIISYYVSGRDTIYKAQLENHGNNENFS